MRSCLPLLLLAAACSSAPGSDDQNISDVREIQILTVSDWHGQLDPLSIPNVGNVGGAAVLSGYFAKHRAENPATLTLTAGDGFGATPPLASFFEDEPAVLAMNLMGIDADGLGNHNFDAGLERLARLIDMAEFPYISANLSGADREVRCTKPALGGVCIHPYVLFDVSGVKVAVVGATNEDAPKMLKPGSMGDITVGDAAAAVNDERVKAEKEGAEVFIAMAHLGATGTDEAGNPVGPLMDWAAKLQGFDLILGDHTNMVVNTKVNGVPVVENKSSGASYAKIVIRLSGRDVEVASVDIVTPLADQVTADARIEELLAPYRDKLAVAFDEKIGTASGIFERGNNVERLKEVPIGNLVADSMRVHYQTELGFTNGGGIRNPLPSSYAPRDTSLRRPGEGFAAGPPYDLVVGDAFAVLPFGNSVVTRNVSGAQLWAMMEHAVSALPEANGFFGQISGFRVTYDSSKPAGQRVVSIVLDGGEAVANDAGVSLTLATSDFIATGGDGYEMLADGDGTSRDKMAEVLLAHMRNLGTLEPVTDGRLKDLAQP